MNSYVLILAAGDSTRMGTCKASLAWVEGKTLLNYQLAQWRRVDVLPVVVLNPNNADCQKSFPTDCQAVINSDPKTGKVGSVLIGLQKIPRDCEMIAIAAVDQPRPAWVYELLLQAHRKNTAPITAPRYRGRFGHPVLFAPSLRSQLESIQEETLGLRQVMETFADQIQAVEFNSAIVQLDLNTPEDYQRAIATFPRIIPSV